MTSEGEPPIAAESGLAGADLLDLASELAQLGRRVRDAVRSTGAESDHDVVRSEGGDDVYGVDARAETELLAGIADLGSRWAGTAIVEGHDDPIAFGDDASGSDRSWRMIVDPVDGTRPFLAGKRSAWVLLGAGRGATTLEDLEIGAMVEIPTDRARIGTVAWAARGLGIHAVDDDLTGVGGSTPTELRPRRDHRIDRSFVTVVRLLPGSHGPIGAWADSHLAGFEVWDDLAPCTGGAMAGLMRGSDTAVFDPRPLLDPTGFACHPYDLSGLVVVREAGVIVEALPSGPLDIPLDTETDVAWAGYANDEIATRLRPSDLPERR